MNKITAAILEHVDELDRLAQNPRNFATVQRELRAAYRQAGGECDPGEGTPDDNYRTLAQSDILKGILDAYFGGTE